MGNEFDRWLEEELSRSFARLDAGYVAPRYLETRAPRRGVSRLLAAIPAMVTAQVAAAGIAVVAAASTGVAVHSVVTGSGTNDPSTWGQKVVQQVQKCKAELGANQHGIGKCVSQFASQNGDNQSDQNGQGAGNDQDGNGDDGTGHGRPSAHPTPQGQGQGASGDHPTAPAHPSPTAHPTGAPAALPTAHPTPPTGGVGKP